jgi:hypothetical protein
LERRLEQLVESHLNRNGKQFRLVRDKLLDETRIPGLRNLNHSTLLRLLFRAISAPTQDDLHEEALQELRREMDVVSKSWKVLAPEARTALQDSGVLDSIRQPTWLSAKVLARQAGAMLSAHVAQHIRDQGLDLNEFRSVRGDYEELASAYARCFEAVSKGIALGAFTRSLPVSGNRIDWKDAKGNIHQLTAAKALELTAFQREPLSSPSFSKLYATIDRKRRNGIGHHADRYDFASGDLHFTDGSQEGFLGFLIELQAFFRLVDWLVELVASWEELLRTGELDLAVRNEPIHPWPNVTPSSVGGRVFVDPVRGPASEDLMRQLQARLDYLRERGGTDKNDKAA